MNKKKTAIITILGYFFIMIICVTLTNQVANLIGGNTVETMDVDANNIIIKLIIQIPPTAYLLYKIKKYYLWKDIGFSDINKKSLLWFLPYTIVLIFMLNKFIYGLYINISSYNWITYMILILTLIGTVLAGFCEEVLFRGILLNSFKSDKSIIFAMIFSSIGFSVFHVTTLVMGIGLLDVLWRIFYSSLLGFAFVGLAIKMNNIVPITVFHIIWNFILMSSHTLKIELSVAAGLCNILNIFMAIILWTIVIVEEIKRKKLINNSYHLY